MTTNPRPESWLPSDWRAHCEAVEAALLIAEQRLDIAETDKLAAEGEVLATKAQLGAERDNALSVIRDLIDKVGALEVVGPSVALSEDAEAVARTRGFASGEELGLKVARVAANRRLVAMARALTLRSPNSGEWMWLREHEPEVARELEGKP